MHLHMYRYFFTTYINIHFSVIIQKIQYFQMVMKNYTSSGMGFYTFDIFYIKVENQLKFFKILSRLLERVLTEHIELVCSSSLSSFCTLYFPLEFVLETEILRKTFELLFVCQFLKLRIGTNPHKDPYPNNCALSPKKKHPRNLLNVILPFGEEKNLKTLITYTLSVSHTHTHPVQSNYMHDICNNFFLLRFFLTQTKNRIFPTPLILDPDPDLEDPSLKFQKVTKINDNSCK